MRVLLLKSDCVRSVLGRLLVASFLASIPALASGESISSEEHLANTLHQVVCTTILGSVISLNRSETRTLRAAQSLNAALTFNRYGVPEEALARVQERIFKAINRDQRLVAAALFQVDPPSLGQVTRLNALQSLEATGHYLDLLVQFNLLCLDEAEYLLRQIKGDGLNFDGGQALALINERVRFHNSELSKIVSDEGLHQIPVKLSNGSRVEGSEEIGGLQPNYIIDAKSPFVVNLYEKVDALKRLNLTPQELIAQVGELVRTDGFDHTSYTDAAYLALLELYRDLGVEIPLSEYLKIRRGTCREVAQLTHLLLERAGLDSFYYYLKVQTIDARGKATIEDHAVDLVKLDGEELIFDNYFRQFNNKKLADLKAGIHTEIGSMYSQVTEVGFAQVIAPRLYPTVRTHPKYIK